MGQTTSDTNDTNDSARDDSVSSLLIPPPPSATAPSSEPPLTLRRRGPFTPRNTVRDTWRWMWKDIAGRCVPFAAAALIYARYSGAGLPAIGLTRAGWRRELTLGLVVGAPLAIAAAAFRRWVAPGYRLPTPADQATQTAFYLAINAPAEELFWRGMLQTLAINGLRRVPGVRALRYGPGLLGWTLTTAVFGLYHRLGNWSWRSIAGVTAAGGLFGALYAWPRRQRSIIAPILAHGLATAGFLSWGDIVLHALARRRAR